MKAEHKIIIGDSRRIEKIPVSQNFKKDSEGLYEIYDRFSFDNLFRQLLNNGFEYEDALNFILCNCSLSALVFQERIYNKYYLNISTEDTISDDLIALRNEILFEIAAKEDIEKVIKEIDRAIGRSKGTKK